MRPYLAITAICIIWGTTYLAIRIGIREFPVFLFSGLRFVIAGLLICIYYLLKGYKFPTGKNFLHLLWSGLFIMTGGNLLLCLAEKHVTSGLAALINAGFPFWVIIITYFMHRAEKASSRIITGLVIGFLGQTMIFYDQLPLLADPVYFNSILLLLASAWSGAYGSVYMKKHTSGLNPVFNGGVQMICAGLATSAIGIIAGEKVPFHAGKETWLSFTYLILAGSIIGYSCFCYALSRLPAAVVTIYTYVNPIVALWLGWLFLDEKITLTMCIAMIITIIGVYMVTRNPSKQSLST